MYFSYYMYEDQKLIDSLFKKLQAHQLSNTLHEFVDRIIDKDIHKYLADKEHNTLAHMAAEMPVNQGGASILKELVDHLDPDVLTFGNIHGITPVHLAAKNQDDTSMEYIREHLGVRIFDLMKDNSAKLPVHYAAMNLNSYSALKWIVEEDSDDCLTRQGGISQYTAAHYAAQFAKEDTMQYICSKLTNYRLMMLKSGDKFGDLPIHCAAQNLLSDSTLRYLVKRFGPKSLLARNRNRMRVIHYCAQYQDGKTMEFVRENSPSCLEMKTKLRRTIAHYAAINKRSDSALRWVVSQLTVSCLREKDRNGTTPGQLCRKYGSADVMKYIKAVLNDH